MLPWTEEVVKNRQSKEDPEANCLPASIPSPTVMHPGPGMDSNQGLRYDADADEL